MKFIFIQNKMSWKEPLLFWTCTQQESTLRRNIPAYLRILFQTLLSSMLRIEKIDLSENNNPQYLNRDVGEVGLEIERKSYF